jgi:hypothetical protein
MQLVAEARTAKEEIAVPKENDLEGVQDQGGKHGGQAGMPKSQPRPRSSELDEDVVQKSSKPQIAQDRYNG